MTLTPEQLHILQHSLGCDKYGETSYRGDNDDDECFGRFHRNRYVSDPTPDLEALVSLGLLCDRGSIAFADGMHYYVVTQHGLGAMIAQSLRKPVLTRSQQRYRRFLAADCGLTFAEWLKCAPNR